MSVDQFHEVVQPSFHSTELEEDEAEMMYDYDDDDDDHDDDNSDDAMHHNASQRSTGRKADSSSTDVPESQRLRRWKTVPDLEVASDSLMSTVTGAAGCRRGR